MSRRDLPTQCSASSSSSGAINLPTTTTTTSTLTAEALKLMVRDIRVKSLEEMRKERSSTGSNHSTTVTAAAFLPVGVNQIKEEMNDPDIQADSEVSLDANSTLAQVLEDFSNDEAPHEPEIEIKTTPFPRQESYRKQKNIQIQMGNVTYQLSDSIFKPVPMNLLSKDMLEQKITEKDPDLVYRKHHNNNNTWARYMPMYYKGVKQNYVRCLECGWLVLHKASTGTGSLLRHKCKIKLPSGVELRVEPNPAPARNLPTKAVASGSSNAVRTQPTAAVMPQHVIEDLARQQACFLYKDVSSSELFDSPSFRTFAQMLINIGAYYGQQDISCLADKAKLMDQIIPNMYQQARSQLNQALVDCDLSYSFNVFRNEAECITYATINSYTIAEDYYFRKINVKTVPVDGVDTFVEGLPALIADMIDREHTEPVKLVHGSTLNIQNENFEMIPCIVTVLWDIMQKIMERFNFDPEQYVDKIFLSDEEDTEDPMKTIMAPFKEPIKSLVSDSSVTISEVVLWKKKLEKHFQVSESDDKTTKAIKQEFQQQIKQNFKLHNYHKIAVFLDPKFKGLRFLSEQERTETIAIVKSQLRRDQDGIEELKKQHSNGRKNSTDLGKETKFIEFMDVSLETDAPDVVDLEVRQYVDVKLEAPVDILSYWRDETAFPLLKKLCQRVLNIPAACDDMKLRFGRSSAEQRDFLRKRSVLRDEEIDMLLYLNQNGP